MTKLATSIGPVGASLKGEGGTPLLFLHGVGSDRSVWDRQLDHFGAQRLTIALDHPGYGDSGPPLEATADCFAEHALAALDSLGLERAHVCGLSLGGVVAIAMHAKAGERIASLVLANSFARHPEGQAILERSLSGAARFGMRGLAEARVEMLLAPPVPPHVRAEVIETMARIDPSAYAHAAKVVWLADQRARARAIACPTLVLCGSEDKVTPPPLSEELKQLVPGAGMVEIAGAGHLSNLDQPGVFNRVLEAFLSEGD